MSKVVIGQLLYARGYDWAPNEMFSLSFLGKNVQVNIDNFSQNDVINLLNLCGVQTSKILVVGAYGSSVDDKLELFFAYEGDLPQARVDIWITNSHHKFAGYAGVQAMVVPAFTKILGGLEQALTNIATQYQIRSFFVKPFEMQNLPPLVLSHNPVNGLLADMRWIRNSDQYFNAFKALNWNAIYYQDGSGKQYFKIRPKNGW